MSTALAAVPTTHAIETYGMHRDQLELLKRTIAKGTTDDEFALFMNTARRLGLDPFAKQIYCVKRYSKKEQREVMSIQVSIDGYRVTASRTGESDGQDGPYWCGPDGVWKDVWLDEKEPAAAKVLVYRKGSSRPFTGVAAYASYVQTDSNGNANQMWSRGPDFMIAKCAEAIALRKAFPAELGGTLTPEEADVPADISPSFGALGSSSTPAPQQQAPTAKAAAPAEQKPAALPLTEDDVVELVTSIAKCASKSALRDIGLKRIRPANATAEQLTRIRGAYEAQLDELDAIEQADREAAQS